jgi:C-terminal processing protease CtpA/Prc
LSLDQRRAALAKKGVSAPSEDWSLKIDSQLATMTLPTFSFWNSKFDWGTFLTNSFAELNAQKVPNLVIDIRDNEGGDGAIGAKIVASLLAQPYRYQSDQSVTTYERVPYVIVRYLDTWDYSFFDRTGKVIKIADGPQTGKFEVVSRAVGERVIVPVAEPYRGRVFILIGGENSSATFQFAWLAQSAGVATLVGQPTGGNLRGLSGGELTWVTLPNAGVAVDIPLLATRYQFDTPDASVMPDILVKRTFDGQKSGEDEEIEVAQRLIREK